MARLFAGLGNGGGGGGNGKDPGFISCVRMPHQNLGTSARLKEPRLAYSGQRVF